MNKFTIGVVVVTYNRLEELKKSLLCYEEQTKKPEYLIVVDNCSTDGTVEYLKGWQQKDAGLKKELILLEENTGGSGGFYTGMKKASESEDADWIWVADDDAFPEKNCFEEAENFVNEYADKIDEISAFCGKCIWNNKIAPVQRCRFVNSVFGKQEMPVPASVFESRTPFLIDLYSFVGTIMKKSDLLKAGLPRKDFFIYQDDYEHAVRMGKIGKIYCVPNIVIQHKDNYKTEFAVSWRDYYATRNVVIMYKEHMSKISLYGRIIRRLLTAYSSLNRLKIKVIKEAVKDGLNNKTGLHEIYRPGWNG